MFKCTDCGNIFDDGEQKNVSDFYPYGDTYAKKEYGVCPACGGEYEATKRCAICNGEFLQDELYNGFCVGCLRDYITYETFLEYAMSDGGYMFIQFMFEKQFGMISPYTFSTKLVRAMRRAFERERALNIMNNKTDLLESCKEFILEDDKLFGKEDFSEWVKSELYKTINV